MCTKLPTNRFVSTTKKSMKYVVNWMSLRIFVRSRNTQPYFHKTNHHNHTLWKCWPQEKWVEPSKCIFAKFWHRNVYLHWTSFPCLQSDFLRCTTYNFDPPNWTTGRGWTSNVSLVCPFLRVCHHVCGVAVLVATLCPCSFWLSFFLSFFGLEDPSQSLD